MSEDPRRGAAHDDSAFEPGDAFYRGIVELGADVLLMMDAGGRVRWANDSGARILGRSRDACTDLDFVELVAEEDKDRTRSVVARWCADGPDRTYAFENRVGVAGDRQHAMRWNVRTFQAEGRTWIALCGHDITPQKRYERALLESEARHRALLAGVLDPLIIIDSLGTVQSVSDSVLPVLGYEPAELVGRNVKVIMPSPHFENHDDYLRNYAETGETGILNRTREFQVVRKDGRLIDVELSVSRVDVPGQAEPAFCGSLRDVTERRQAERALLERERVFRAIFDQEFQFVGLCSTDGVLLEANRTALESVGATRDDVVGRPFWDTPWWAGSPADQERLRDAVRRATCGEFVRFPFEFVDAAGAVRHVDFSLKPVFDERGMVSVLIPEGRDVTDLEEARRAETEMYKALAELGESAAVLAHEVKNPITAVNLALRAVADRLGEDSKAALEDLVGRMQNLERTLRATLTFAKPIHLHRERVGSTALVHGVLAELRVDFARAGVLVDLAEDWQDLALDADPVRLGEVLSNLLRNAMQATGRGGRVIVGCDEAGPGRARITVEDDGVGIPADLRPRLFKPFVSRRPGGTGLGLSICRRIVEAHGGAIDAGDGTLGGACFELCIPMFAPRSTPAGRTDQPSQGETQ